jgi:hypothetical protein
LDPFEVHAHDVSERMHGFGFCQARDAFYQHMASAEHIDDDGIDETFHADNLFMDLFIDRFEVRMVEKHMLKSFTEELRIHVLSFSLFVGMFFTQESEDILFFIQYEKIDNTSENRYA